MGKLLKYGLLIIAGFLVYNYFFGDAEDKARSKKVFTEIGSLGKAVGEFVKDEHQKIKDGKFDKVINNLEKAYSKIDAKVSDLDPSLVKEFNKLKKNKRELKRELNEKEKANPDGLSKEDRKDMQGKFKKLLEKSNELFEQL